MRITKNPAGDCLVVVHNSRHASLLSFVALVFMVSHLRATDRPNVLLLCVDDLRPELACYGVETIQSPNIDTLADQGRLFHHHYVQAPTCGASRYALLTGNYGPYRNDALFQRAKKLVTEPDAVNPSLPAWFRQHGYTTVSVGKVSHHPGGRGGPDWDDESVLEMPNAWTRHLMPAGAWQHPRGCMHGLAHGEIRGRAEEMDVFQSEPGDDDLYPDGLITIEALKQLELLAQDHEHPFFLAVGFIRPHLPFGAPARYLEPYRDAVLPPIPHPEKPLGKTTWHHSAEFMKYHRWQSDPRSDVEFANLVRKHYAACVTYVDELVGRVLSKLAYLGCRENTIVVLWGDHGWHLGEHGVWGKHTLFEESLRSPLIVVYPGIADAGSASQSIVETIDIYPTLCDLAQIPYPNFVDGTSLAPILNDPAARGHPAFSVTATAKSVRTATHRLIAHNDGHLELYDLRSDVQSTQNIATTDVETVHELLPLFEQRFR